MYEQLYSINEDPFSLFDALVVPVTVAFILIGGTIGILWDRYKKKEYKNMLFGMAFILFILFQLKFFVSIAFIENQQKNRLTEILNSLNAKEVEGEIKEFIARNSLKKIQESFVVDGIKFTYSRALNTGAYVRKNDHLEEGQYVRIFYVYDKNWDMNLILKLEIKNKKTTITKEPIKQRKPMTTQILDENNEKLQEELRVFYEKFFSDELHKALASSQNLHNPTFDPLIDAFPFAIRSTASYKKIEQKFKKNGYKIKGKIEFEKFHTSSTKTSYGFHFSPLFFRPIPIEESNSNNEKVFFECREIIDVKLTPYFTKRKHFIKNNECMSKDDSLIINSKTKKSIELTGYGTAIKKFSVADQEILQVNSHMGTHTNGVSFFFIEKNGDLKLMKNGVMTSDVGDPKVMLNNGIEVKTQYSKDEKLCRYLFEDTFTYDKKNKTFLKTKNGFKLLKRCADDS